MGFVAEIRSKFFSEESSRFLWISNAEKKCHSLSDQGYFCGQAKVIQLLAATCLMLTKGGDLAMYEGTGYMI